MTQLALDDKRQYMQTEKIKVWKMLSVSAGLVLVGVLGMTTGNDAGWKIVLGLVAVIVGLWTTKISLGNLKAFTGA